MEASIVITAYKRNDFLINAIESCLNQDFKGMLEIIIVDDNGKGTECQIKNQENLSEYIEKGQIRYIVHERNMGACAARNMGGASASGKYLFFLDDDDEFLPSKVSIQVSFLQEHPDYDAHASAFLKKRNGKDFPSTDGLPIIGDLKNYLMYGNVYTPMLCIKRDVFLNIGGFDEIPKFQDMYFVGVFLDQGKKMYAGTEPLFIQNDHNAQRISNRAVENAETAVVKFQEFAAVHKELFSPGEWLLVQTRLAKLLATTYYSSTYSNRLKSVRYWAECLKLSKDITYLYPILKCIFPNNWIKWIESLKSKNVK